MGFCDLDVYGWNKTLTKILLIAHMIAHCSHVLLGWDRLYYIENRTEWHSIVKFGLSFKEVDTVTTDLNCFTVPLPCEFSGVKGRCLAPFLLLMLCQERSHGKELWETEAHLLFKRGKSLDLNLLLQLGDCFVCFFRPAFLLLSVFMLRVISNKNAVHMRSPVRLRELLIAKGKPSVFKEWPWLWLSWPCLAVSYPEAAQSLSCSVRVTFYAFSQSS